MRWTWIPALPRMFEYQAIQIAPEPSIASAGANPQQPPAVADWNS
jgi:hypothetical protein